VLDDHARNGQDPVALIISANIQRRHLTKGQQAMAIVKAQSLVPKEKPKQKVKREKGASAQACD